MTSLRILEDLLQRPMVIMEGCDRVVLRLVHSWDRIKRTASPEQVRQVLWHLLLSHISLQTVVSEIYIHKTTKLIVNQGETFYLRPLFMVSL